MQESTWKILLAISVLITIVLIGYIFIYKPRTGTASAKTIDLYIYQGAGDVHSIISNDLYLAPGWLLRFKFTASPIPVPGYKEINLRLLTGKFTGYGFDGVSPLDSDIPGLKIYVNTSGAAENRLCFQSAKYNYTSGVSTVIYNLGDCIPGSYKKMQESSWIKDITCYPESLQKWNWIRVNMHYKNNPLRIWYGDDPPSGYTSAGRFYSFSDENVKDTQGKSVEKTKLGIWEVVSGAEKSRIISASIPDKSLSPVLITNVFLPISKATDFYSRAWFLLKSKSREQTKFVINLGYVFEQTKEANSDWMLIGTYNALYGGTIADFPKFY